VNYKVALKWTAYYRGIAWAAALVGLGMVVLGLRVANGAFPTGLPGVVDAATSTAFLPFALAGFVVWQVGTTAAFYKTTTEAVDEQLAERFDPELIKSDMLSVLDERLSEMHSELEATHRAVDEMQADSGGFEVDD
jgi:hypothetical protein